jgi:CTP synthase (UTP-ammonia lyase)
VQHAAGMLRADVSAEWISTLDVDEAFLSRVDGIWVAPGSPYKSLKNTVAAIRHAREQGVPCFGTCGGFQHLIIEYARHVLGYAGAHAEYDPDAVDLFIARLSCSLAGRTMRLAFTPDSQVAGIYGSTEAVEEYYCNFGVNPARLDVLKQGPLRIVGADAEGDARVIELPGHPFFVGTLYVPQMRSRPERPHPLVTAFVRASVERAGQGRVMQGANEVGERA